MGSAFHFECSLDFSAESAAETLRAIPALPGVSALHGPPAAEGHAEAQPYLTRAADLRRRITRILAPLDSQSKRLNLRKRVARIEYTVTGSEFESALCLYHASAAIFGFEEARRRLKLRTPFFLRFTAENAHPRVYSTNRLSKRALENFYGPFPSRLAADRYCDAVLDLFKLRRCYEELQPFAEHPGCVYQEMKKCLAPCNQAHTPAGAEAYSAEAAAVKRFFDTRGESMIAEIGVAREEASAAMEFERAAELHAQWQKVKAAQSLAAEIVQPIPQLRGVIVQPVAQHAKTGAPRLASETWVDESEPAASVFLLHSGCIAGPERLSTLGVRAVKEQTSVGSSLFAQPLMLQAIPLDEAPASQPGSPESPPPLSSRSEAEGSAFAASAASSAIDPGTPRLDSETWAQPTAPTLNPEARAAGVISSLEDKASAPTDLATLSDHLSLLRRWYYRPEKQRTGEIFFPSRRTDGSSAKDDNAAAKADASWPIRRILNGAARMALGTPKPLAETQRDLATRNPTDAPQKPTRTKVLHAGRPDVERVVPVIDKPPAFKSRKPQA